MNKLLTHLTPLHRFKYYEICLSFFVVVLLISNLVASKLCYFGHVSLPGFDFDLILSGAQLLFPITYIFGDIFTEVYGYAGSRRAIWHGFLSMSLLTALGMVIVSLPPAPGWNNQPAFESIFGFLPRLVVASLIAYWCGEFANAFVLAKMKVITEGKMLWARTIASTAVGQLVDTIIVMTIAFWGRIDGQMIRDLIVTGYLVKVGYEAAATPVTYLVVGFLKRAEGIDLFDDATNFNPFSGGPVGEEQG
ncbi:MAG: queuosine precursor transporter [Acidobacteria bacterium]|nr:queuosine precursor transporter [Acidobacteriota bacterium]